MRVYQVRVDDYRSDIFYSIDRAEKLQATLKADGIDSELFAAGIDLSKLEWSCCYRTAKANMQERKNKILAAGLRAEDIGPSYVASLQSFLEKIDMPKEYYWTAEYFDAGSTYDIRLMRTGYKPIELYIVRYAKDFIEDDFSVTKFMTHMSWVRDTYVPELCVPEVD